VEIHQRIDRARSNVVLEVGSECDESGQRLDVVHALERQFHLAPHGGNLIARHRDEVRDRGTESRQPQRPRGILTPDRIGILQVVDEAVGGNLSGITNQPGAARREHENESGGCTKRHAAA
jgi:hypothetical protein